jgi:hypothetical protein
MSDLEGFQQSFRARAMRRAPDRPGGPQSLATLHALQVESLKYGVCSDFH